MDKVRLSPYQQVFYNQWKLEPNSCRHHNVFDQSLSNTLDIQKLKAALNRLVLDHLLLNSHVVEVDEDLYWIKNSQISQLEYFDNNLIYEKIFEYTSRPFDVNNGPLYRFAIFVDDENNYRFIIVCHQLIMDKVAGDILISEISNYYNNHEYKTQYSISEQIEINANTNKLFNDQVMAEALQAKEFWQTNLMQVEAVDLRFLKRELHDNNPVPVKTSPIKEIKFSISKQQVKKLKDVILDHDITPYTYSLSIFAILLYRYTGQKKFGISYPVTIKGGINFICGVKLNTNIIPFTIDNDTSIADIFERNCEFNKSLRYNEFSYKKFPVNEIIQDTKLFNVVFAQDSLDKNKLAFTDVKTIAINNQFNVGLNANLFFTQELNDDNLNFKIRYHSDKIDTSILHNFIEQYQKLFFEVLTDLEQNICNKSVMQYQILSAEDKLWLLPDLKNTNRSYPKNKTIHALFEEQVAKTPDAIAIVYQNIQLTYGELNTKANQLANYLRNTYYIKPDVLCALFLERNEYMLIALLAVLKSGGAYVPIDLNYSHEKIKFILSDSRPKIILTNEIHQDKLITITNEEATLITDVVSVLAIDSNVFRINLNNQTAANLVNCVSGTDLAYIMYTDETKGVMVEHKSVINVISNIVHTYDVTANRVSVFSSYAFGESITEIFAPLSVGARLYLLPEYLTTNMDDLGLYVINNQINHMYLPATLLSIFPKSNYPDLRRIIYAGELSDRAVGKYWSNYLELYSFYGWSETTAYSLAKRVIDGDTHLIGKALNNCSAYILGSKLSLLPIGAVGELYIGGDGVARGYFNKPELTAESFIANPFQTEAEKLDNKNNKLYKTGNLARYLADGTIEYVYDQIKIGYYTVEAREIENILNTYPGIKQSIVVVKTTDLEQKNELPDKYMVAYYVSTRKLNDDDLSFYLGSYLPENILPNIYIRLDALLLMPSGRVDLGALPHTTFEICYKEPQTKLEAQICAIYAGVFGISPEKIGVSTDFLMFGGNNIKAIQICRKIKSMLNLNICPKNIFTFRTIENLYKHVIVEQLNDNYVKPTILGEDVLYGKWDLLPTKEWLFNQPFVTGLNKSLFGKQSLLDTDSLNISLGKLLALHNGFRWHYIKTLNNSSTFPQAYTQKIVITTQSLSHTPNVFDNLQAMAQFVPVAMYWEDLNGVFLGANEQCLSVLNVKSLDQFVGKNIYDYHSKEIADELSKYSKLAISKAMTVENEEQIIDSTTAVVRYFRGIRSPLRDNNQVVVGVVITLIEITAQKAELSLALENNLPETTSLQQAKFKKLIEQVVHDIRSPIASMQMILPLCDTLPEKLRVSLNKSATRTLDIANNFLNKFTLEMSDAEVLTEPNIVREPTLISADLLEIITEKKYEYSAKPLDFISNISQSGYFAFINIDAKAIKRSLSNLINNAVDASTSKKSGKITISLDSIEDTVQIIIQDNGKGMPNVVKEKILNNIAVTSGKVDGHGIGFTQIREALANNEGTLDIDSKVGVGTKIILTFPKVDSPAWIAQKIELRNDSNIVILDDDESIHGAWDARFKELAPHLELKHFQDGREVIAFINSLNDVEKDKILLLADYELLHQDLNGVDVIKKTGIKRSILVTSHHNNQAVYNLAKSANIKILPKPLAAQIPIYIVNGPQAVDTLNKISNADLVFINDDKEFASVFKRIITDENKTLDTYYNVQDFMDNVSKYPKDTMIMLDNPFQQENITSVELAKQLYWLGFESLYLFSGTDYSNDKTIPWYLTPILKTDVKKVKQIIHRVT